jgi:hypothetical protein
MIGFISKSLAILTPFVVLKAIFQDGRPKIFFSPYHPLHFVSRLLCSAYTFMYLAHESFGFFRTDAFEQHTINRPIIKDHLQAIP